MLTFVDESTDEGEKAQAVAAAVFGLVFDDVKTSRVFDPSRHFPGDIHVLEGAKPSLAVEARAKPVSEADVLLFRNLVARARNPRATMVAIRQKDTSLPPQKLIEHALSQ